MFFSNYLAVFSSNLYVILLKLTPLWLSQDDFDPFLNIGTINDCDQSDGITLDSQILS